MDKIEACRNIPASLFFGARALPHTENSKLYGDRQLVLRT